MNKQEKLYESIVDDIKKKYIGKLSEPEAHEATRRLIEFVKIIMEVDIRLQKEKDNNAAI